MMSIPDPGECKFLVTEHTGVTCMPGVSMGPGELQELYSGPVIINLSCLASFYTELPWTVLDFGF